MFLLGPAGVAPAQQLGTSASPSFADLTLASATATTLTIAAAAGQTANLLSLDDSTGTPRVVVSAALGLNFKANGLHINTESAVTDIAGVITVTGGTGSITFAVPYTHVPSCVASPVQNPQGYWWLNSSTSTLQITLTYTASSVVFNYVCIGSPN
ncbi:MAG TPA: hypothetical protein VN924_11195 [Bryobacteraceae bacterium]|nr:hypothetical protein [Bryobacteraceae bacterium]